MHYFLCGSFFLHCLKETLGNTKKVDLASCLCSAALLLSNTLQKNQFCLYNCLSCLKRDTWPRWPLHSHPCLHLCSQTRLKTCHSQEFCCHTKTDIPVSQCSRCFRHRADWICLQCACRAHKLVATAFFFFFSKSTGFYSDDEKRATQKMTCHNQVKFVVLYVF